MVWRMHAALDCNAQTIARGQIGQLHVTAFCFPGWGLWLGLHLEPGF